MDADKIVINVIAQSASLVVDTNGMTYLTVAVGEVRFWNRFIMNILNVSLSKFNSVTSFSHTKKKSTYDLEFLQ